MQQADEPYTFTDFLTKVEQGQVQEGKVGHA
jgi:hypothetical protein